MDPEIVALMSGLFIVLFTLSCISEIFFSFHWVNYDCADVEKAIVWISRFCGSRFPRRYEDIDISFIFERSANGKWKYKKDSSEIKKRIITFVISFIVITALYTWFLWYADAKWPSFWTILIIFLLTAFFSFLTLITNPLVAYAILLRDLRKKQ